MIEFSNEMTEDGMRNYLSPERLDSLTADDISPLIKEIMALPHGYGSVCVAMAMIAVAACKAANREPNGGITGFQAGAVFWEFARKFLSLKGPMSLITYKDMLYPQYRASFEKTISSETMEWLQNEAKKMLDDDMQMSPDVKAHMESIVNGVVPFGYKIKDEL